MSESSTYHLRQLQASAFAGAFSFETDQFMTGVAGLVLRGV
jgi:hypothetical protein